MAYDETLADRIRAAIQGQRGWKERKMFGGLCFTLRGNMCCGIVGDTLMLRLGDERAKAALRKPHTREMDFTGRPMRGMIYVDPKGIASTVALRSWIELASGFVHTLPRKPVRPRATQKRPIKRRSG